MELEQKLQRKLDLSRRVHSGRDLAERCRSERDKRNGELRVVPDVEELRAELEFAGLRNLERFENGGVEVDLARPV